MRHSLVVLVVIAACSSQPPEDCSAEEPTLTDRVASRLLFYEGFCTTDNDCVLVSSSVSCVKGCPTAVVASRATMATNDLANFDSDICGGTSCIINIGCNPTHPVCKLGSCVNADGALDAGFDAGVPDAGSSADGGH